MSAAEPLIRRAVPDDVARLAPRLRAEDRRAAAAFTGGSGAQALAWTLSRSPVAWTAEVDGVPVAMFGVALDTPLAAAGQPWLVGSDALRRHARTLLRLAPSFLLEMRRAAGELGGLVDGRDEGAHRLLERLGFRVGPPVTLDGALFCRIRWEGP